MTLEAVVGERRLNTFAAEAQTAPSAATFEEGGHVVVWQSRGQDGSDQGIFAQLYDANGSRDGIEFQVNLTAQGAQRAPDVAVLSDGRFVVVWTDATSPDGAGEGVVGRIFARDDGPRSDEFVVNGVTAANQRDASVIALADGGFAVAYVDDGVSSDRVRVSLFDGSGERFSEAAVAVTAAEADQTDPAIAAMADGGFVVTWQDGGDGQAYAQIFDATGGTDGVALPVGDDRGGALPTVAGLADGSFVVAWAGEEETDVEGTGADIFAQRFAGPDFVGSEIVRINTTTALDQTAPTITALDDGGYVIAWQGNGEIADAADDAGVFFQEFAADGSRIDGERRLNDGTEAPQRDVVLTALPADGLLAAWTTDDPTADGSSSAVLGRLFGDPDNFTSVADPVLVDFARQRSIEEAVVNAGPVRIDDDVTLTDSDSETFAGGQLRLDPAGADGPAPSLFNVADAAAQHQFGLATGADGPVSIDAGQVAVDGVIVGTIAPDLDGRDGRSLVIDFDVAASLERVEVLLEHLTYANASNDPMTVRDYQLNLFDGTGGSFVQTVTIEVVPEQDSTLGRAGPVTPVNTFVAGTQSDAVVASFGDGRYVAVWTSFGQDGSSDGVYARLFDGDGSPSSDEFVVNVTTAGAQNNPHVDVLNDGTFIVIWDDSSGADGDGAGILGRRFAADGTPLSGELVLNGTTASDQFASKIAALADGGFAVVFDDTSSFPLTTKVRIFDNDGIETVPEFFVDPSPSGTNQQFPNIAALADGGFVVTWQEFPGDADLYAQAFDARGVSRFDAFLVTAANAGYQAEASLAPMAVAGLTGGEFVVVWTDNASDWSSTSIFAEVFDAAGGLLQPAFLVNQTTSGTQSLPTVAALPDGGFTIAWSGNGVGDADGVFMQAYDASGARVDGEQRVPADSEGNQRHPAIVALPSGIVVLYEDVDGDDRDVGIVQQRFANTAPVTTPVTVVGFEDTDLVLDSTSFASGFVDAEGTSLQAVRVETLPSNGTLLLDGAALTVPTVIDVADLVTGKLVYRGVPDFAGADQFAWRGSDGALFSALSDVAEIVLANVDDAPIVDDQGFVYEENRTGSLGVVTARDPDPGETLTYALVAGNEAGIFTIDATTGLLEAAAALDYEAQPEHVLTVEVTDGAGLQDVGVVTVTVADVDEAPSFVTPSSVAVLENGPAFVMNIAVTDPEGLRDGEGLTYGISGGADAALFTLEADSGVLRFISSPDFETPRDADGDNVYEVGVRVSDEVNVTDQVIDVTVVDVDPATPTTQLRFVAETAKFANALGWYDVRSGEAGLLFTDSGDAWGVVGTFTGTDDPGFFIIPDGGVNFAPGGLLAGRDVETLDLRLVERDDGRTVVATSDGIVLEGRRTSESELEQLAYFSEATRNPDDVAHAVVNDDGTLGWEDSWNGGDGDFDDLMLRAVSVVDDGLI